MTGEPQQGFVELVTGNSFSVLGVRPAMGRFFLPDEDSTPGRDPVAVLSAAVGVRRRRRPGLGESGAGRHLVAPAGAARAEPVDLTFDARVLSFTIVVSLATAERLLYGVSTTDPATFGSVAAILLFVALAASAVPAWRASRLDPLLALR